MLHAVAQKKAHRFFDKTRLDSGPSIRRPQEDMVTSALFGSVSFLPDEDRRAALELLLGGTFAGALSGGDVKIELWPSLRDPDPKSPLGRVEPDVLLTCGGQTMIVEVKWHSGLGPDQLHRQLAAARREGYRVRALLVLGASALPSETNELPIQPVLRRWQEVSTALAGEATGMPLGRWRKAVRDFLQRTDLGHVFAGFCSLGLEKPGTVARWFDHS